MAWLFALPYDTTLVFSLAIYFFPSVAFKLFPECFAQSPLCSTTFFSSMSSQCLLCFSGFCQFWVVNNFSLPAWLKPAAQAPSTLPYPSILLITRIPSGVLPQVKSVLLPYKCWPVAFLAPPSHSAQWKPRPWLQGFLHTQLCLCESRIWHTGDKRILLPPFSFSASAGNAGLSEFSACFQGCFSYGIFSFKLCSCVRSHFL